MKRIANARALANALRRCALLLFTLVVLSAPALAQQFDGAGTAPAEPQNGAPAKANHDPAKTALAGFAWLAGSWQGQWGPRVAQQVWMPAQSGTMVGVFQLSENTKTLVVELYSIVSTPRGIELRVRHFTPSLIPWPADKSGAALLNLKSIDSKSILFENANDGQPKSWLMTRTGPDAFVQKFEIVSKKDQHQVDQIVYHRQPASTPPGR